MQRKVITLWTDGACDNGGTAVHGTMMGMGIVIATERSRKDHYELLEACLGMPGTSNMAEWLAMYRGLRKLLAFVRAVECDPYCVLEIRSDSMLVVRCLKDEWRSSKPNLAAYCRACMQLLHYLRDRGHEVNIKWIPRERNNVADMLSKVGRKSLGERPSRVVFKDVVELQKKVKELNQIKYHGGEVASIT